MQTIDATELRAMMDQDDGLLLIDTLPQESYEETHIDGAYSVPAQNENFVSRVEELAGARNETIVVYCANEECGLSPTAAQKLEDAGFTDVLDFEGGLQEWSDAGYPLVRQAGAQRGG